MISPRFVESYPSRSNADFRYCAILIPHVLDCPSPTKKAFVSALDANSDNPTLNDGAPTSAIDAMSHPLHLAGAFQRGTAEVHPLSDSTPAR
jgi:hypothetical protein